MSRGDLPKVIKQAGGRAGSRGQVSPFPPIPASHIAAPWFCPLVSAQGKGEISWGEISWEQGDPPEEGAFRLRGDF